jgi:hypothetical protein
MKNPFIFVVDFFCKPITTTYKVVCWFVVALVYATVFCILLSLSGCSSFQKTTKYNPNTYWHLEKL